jgi:hypothetical protein
MPLAEAGVWRGKDSGASSATEESMLEFELTLLGDAFERLAGILDPVLIIVAVGR